MSWWLSPFSPSRRFATICRIYGRQSKKALTTCKDAAPFGEDGQSTIEFVLVTIGFLAVAVALGALWKMLGEGKAVEHALISASHHVQLAAAGAMADILLY